MQPLHQVCSLNKKRRGNTQQVGGQGQKVRGQGQKVRGQGLLGQGLNGQGLDGRQGHGWNPAP